MTKLINQAVRAKARESVGSLLLAFDMSKAKLKIMHEVIVVDERSQKINSLGFYSDKNVADALTSLENADIAGGRKTVERLVLTDEEFSLLVDHSTEVVIADDEATLAQLKQIALEKLSPEERKLLNLS